MPLMSYYKLESKPGDLYLGSWKPHGLNDIEMPNTGKTVCGTTMDLVPARARIHFEHPGVCDF